MALSQITIKDESEFHIMAPVIERNLPLGRLKVLVDLKSNLPHFCFAARVQASEAIDHVAQPHFLISPYNLISTPNQMAITKICPSVCLCVFCLCVCVLS